MRNEKNNYVDEAVSCKYNECDFWKFFYFHEYKFILCHYECFFFFF